MNGKCFSSRGNDISPVCSCPEGMFFDASRAVCDHDQYISQSEIVVVWRNFSGVYYREQAALLNLTRGVARFPNRWVCDRINRFCRASEQGVYYTTLDIDNIDTDDRQPTSLRFSDVMWYCTGGRVFYRRNDDMSTDADLGNGMRPAHENCVTPSVLCSAIGTGTSSFDDTKCECNDGWTGSICQTRLAYDIARPVSPVRSCTFPSANSCAPNEECYLWERPSGTQFSNPAIGHRGWCWCKPGYVPAGVDPLSKTADACIQSSFTKVYGVPAMPYTPNAPSYNVDVDARTKQYIHYNGQGYQYASIAPYPISVNNSFWRINDTIFDESGYLWRCDSRSVWNESAMDCTLTWSRPASEAQVGEDVDIFQFDYSECESIELFGPQCTWNATVCAEERCSSRGVCIGTHQGCLCDRGWGGYNCTRRECGTNDVAIPAQYEWIDFERLLVAEEQPPLPHVWNETAQKCNCSAYYQGQFCESYTCGDKFAVYNFSTGACQCRGFWGLNSTSGKCTVNLCAEEGFRPDRVFFNLCSAMTAEELAALQYVAPVLSSLFSPDDDLNFVPPPHSWSDVSIATFSMGLLQAFLIVSSSLFFAIAL